MSIQLIGMVHLGPLPGSPRFSGDLESILGDASRDAEVLASAGFDAVMVENFGDAPFFADDVPAVTVAAMARAVAAITGEIDLPVGVNILRNDARASLAVAATCGASFIRVNVLSGTMHTDQGIITGRAAELARMRVALAPHVEVLADVFVKHASPPAGLTIAQAAADTYRRGGADALIVSGTSTGAPPDGRQLAEVRAAVPEARLLAGSGASVETIRAILEYADGAIVGTAIKADGRTTAPVDPDRARRFVRAARS
ncbi:MAG: BtpA/SgcQ family protein [Acidimicrobiia bacterium]|nr:BtpA/SgcQ family protein [Acidimicrobiia bacterium]